MGVFGFVAAGGGSIGVTLGGILTDSLDWHWIFLVNFPIGLARRRPVAPAPSGRPDRGRGRQARRRRRDHRDQLADARRLRDRERQPEGLDIRPDARPAGRVGRAPRRLPRDRVARRLAAHAASALPASEPGDRERDRHPVGGVDVRLVLPLGALHAARPGLHAARGGPGVPARQPDHGRVLARPLRQARHAVRHQAAALGRPPRGRRGHGALRARAGRRELRLGRAAEHDPARVRRRARRSTRCCSRR